MNHHGGNAGAAMTSPRDYDLREARNYIQALHGYVADEGEGEPQMEHIREMVAQALSFVNDRIALNEQLMERNGEG